MRILKLLLRVFVKYILKKFSYVGLVRVMIPLKQPRLQEDAVPTIFPNCPKYFSRINVRESLPKKYSRLESDHLQAAIAESVKTSADYDKQYSFNSIGELMNNLNNIGLPHSWNVVFKNNQVLIVNISSDPVPQIMSSVKIDDNLLLSVFVNDIAMDNVKDMTMPLTVKNVHEISKIVEYLSDLPTAVQNFKHKDALVAVCGTKLSKWCEEAASAPMADTLSVAPVVEFLQTAGQEQLVQQFGPQFKEHGRNFRWREWLEILLKEFTVSKCQETVTEFHTLYTMESVGVTTIQSSVSLNFQLQDAIGEHNSKLHNLYERQLMESVQDKNAFAAVLSKPHIEATRNAKATQHRKNQFVLMNQPMVTQSFENSQQNHLSFLCIFVTAFCGIYKRLMMMEKSALAAGESLVDLTSYGGYWFLDEMYSICSNITEFVRLLIDSWPTLDSEAKANFNGVHLAYCIFSSLEDLSFNFQNIILPEAIQRSLEPSVVEMITKLDHIIARCGVSRQADIRIRIQY